MAAGAEVATAGAVKDSSKSRKDQKGVTVTVGTSGAKTSLSLPR